MYTLTLLSVLAVAAGEGNHSDPDALINIYQYSTLLKTGPDYTGDDDTSTEINDDPVEPDLALLLGENCPTVNHEKSKCVPYYLCEGNSTVFNDGIATIDISVRDGPCSSFLQVCCLQSERRSSDNPITPKPFTDPNKNNKNESEQLPKCGWRNPEGVGMKIIGDVNGESKFGEFPWVVSVSVPINIADVFYVKLYIGMGSLIHPSIVLTAAHVATKNDSLTISAGDWDTTNENEIYPRQVRNVESKIIHNDFNKGNLIYDIALLFLSEPVELAPNVGIACLPPPRERVPGGTRCFSSWWRREDINKGGIYSQLPIILKNVEVPVVDRNSCQSAYRKTRLGQMFELHTSFMCTGEDPGQEICKAYTGSPLACPIEFENGRYMQSGIISWKHGCGEDRPVVYVDVSNLREWIDDKVKGKGYDTRGYSITNE